MAATVVVTAVATLGSRDAFPVTELERAAIALDLPASLGVQLLPDEFAARLQVRDVKARHAQRTLDGLSALCRSLKARGVIRAWDVYYELPAEPNRAARRAPAL